MNPTTTWPPVAPFVVDGPDADAADDSFARRTEDKEAQS